MKREAEFTVLLLILAAGLALRVMRFDAIAPTNSDEGSYLKHARLMVTVMKMGAGVNVPVVDAGKEGIWRYVRKQDWSAKPCWLHSFLMALAMLAFGVGDGAGALVNVVFSLAAVVAVYLIARRSAGPRAAAFAAGLLAVSFYWMIYSRGMWAEVDGVFFVLTALLILQRASGKALASCWWCLLLSGGLAATGVLCHYRLLYVIAPLGLSSFLLAPRGSRLRAAALVGAGFIGFLAATAGLLRVAVTTAAPGFPFTGLLGALAERYLPGGGGVEQKGLQFENLLAVGYYLGRNNGWPTLLLCVAGVTSVILGRGKDKVLTCAVVFLVSGPAVLCFQVWVVARAASLAVPFLCLLAGVGASRLLDAGAGMKPVPRTVVAAGSMLLLCGAAVGNLLADIRLVNNNVAYEGITDRLEKENARRVFVDPESEHIYGWHAPHLPYESSRELPAELAADRVSGSFAVFDPQKYHMYDASRRRVDALEQRTQKRAELAWRLPNLTTAWREFLMDGTQAHSLGEMLKSVRSADKDDIKSVRVYRFK